MNTSTKAPKQSITAPGILRADEVYTLDEFAARSRLGKWARRVLSKRGGLKSTRLGNRRFILGSDFIEFLKRQAGDESLES